MQAQREPAHTRLGIVVVAFNSADVFERNIGTLSLPRGGTLVVADNSTDAEQQHAIREIAGRFGWHYVAVADNPGFGAAANVGAEVALDAGCDALLFLNPDARIDTASIARLRDAQTARSILSPRIVRSDGKTWFANGSLDMTKGIAHHSAGGRTDWITGACMFVPAPIWRELGGFNDRYFLYWEDVDLSYRLRMAGGDLKVIDQAVAVHEVGATQSGDQDFKSDQYFYYNSRNRLLFAASSLSRRQALWWVLVSPIYWRRLAKRGRPELSAQLRYFREMARGTFVGARAALVRPERVVEG